LPIPLPPAHQETISSYLTRLATLHGLDPQELWEPISIPTLPGRRRRTVAADLLTDLTGRRAEHLGWALPELRQPAPDWTALRHQAQGGCPRCDARHLGGPVTRLLAHHRYVCTRHRYWIGPPDIDQPATILTAGLDDIVAAQRHHLRLLHRHGCAAVYDAVLTGLMICGHLWNERTKTPTGAWHHWTRRADLLIPPGTESASFSASRLFAAVYPEAVNLAALISSPTWRRLATGDTNQQRRFTTEVGRRLGDPHYEPSAGDPIAHWMITDASRPPSRPNKAFPDTRSHGATRPTTTSAQSQQRHDRSSHWFGRHRRGGGIILHHRHIQPVLIREWSPKMDGFDAQIWASRTTVAI
jgi:hypothetical protein